NLSSRWRADWRGRRPHRWPIDSHGARWCRGWCWFGSFIAIRLGVLPQAKPDFHSVKVRFGHFLADFSTWGMVAILDLRSPLRIRQEFRVSSVPALNTRRQMYDVVLERRLLRLLWCFWFGGTLRRLLGNLLCSLHFQQLFAESILPGLFRRTTFHHRLDWLRLDRWRRLSRWRRRNRRVSVELILAAKRSHLFVPLLPAIATLVADLLRCAVVLLRT